MTYEFRKANSSEIAQVWDILQQAIIRRKADGSDQWQDGYPNPEVVRSDINQGIGFVLIDGDMVVGYCAVLINDEPQYASIEGKWLTNDDFVVVHRVAVAGDYAGRGLAKAMLERVEEFAMDNRIYSIKADTNFDNIAMTKTFERLGYTHCGLVYFRGSPRMAYEKVLKRSEQLPPAD